MIARVLEQSGHGPGGSDDRCGVRFDWTDEPAAELAETVAALAPSDINRTIFSTGGSTAVDTAVRLAHFYQYCRGKPAKRHLISRKQAYHGSTYMAASLTG